MFGLYHPLDEFCNIDMTKTIQFRIYQQILADKDECKMYSTDVKEHAVRTVLNYIIDNNEMDIGLLCCFSSPNIYKHVTESFLRQFADYVDWERAEINFKFSEDFIKEELPIKNWMNISIYQTLSENFIHEFRDRVDWDEVSRHQVMSVEFMKKHRKEVNWEIAIIYQESWFRRINNLD